MTKEKLSRKSSILKKFLMCAIKIIILWILDILLLSYFMWYKYVEI